MGGMSVSQPALPDPPQWLQAPVLRVPLHDAEAKLAELITLGRRLEAEVPKATNAEVFTRRVHEWRRYSSEWLDENLGGQAADEYKVAITYAKTHTWSIIYWDQYHAARKMDIASEIRVLVSIAQRLSEWVESGDRTSASGSADQKEAAIRDSSVPEQDTRQSAAVAKNRNAVMVIYGHDQEANDALFAWLRAIGLQPREWSQLVRLSGSASPYNGQVLEHAFQNTQAVVALFTPDEYVRATGGSTWRFQARPNVLIEAGMALITHPDRTIIITLGPQELPSDLAGRHYIQLDGTAGPLNVIANLLESAGCEIDRTGTRWLNPEIFPNRDSIPTRPQEI